MAVDDCGYKLCWKIVLSKLHAVSCQYDAIFPLTYTNETPTAEGFFVVWALESCFDRRLFLISNVWSETCITASPLRFLVFPQQQKKSLLSLRDSQLQLTLFFLLFTAAFSSFILTALMRRKMLLSSVNGPMSLELVNYRSLFYSSFICTILTLFTDFTNVKSAFLFFSVQWSGEGGFARTELIARK